MDEIKVVSEAERSAVEKALLVRFGIEKPLACGAAGGSPYSPVAVVYGPAECRQRGVRVALTAVCRSHDGAGSYKGRGRWKTVYAVAPVVAGSRAVCDPGDRDAEEVGASGWFTRPWTTQEAEEASAGMGLGASALADALGTLGLNALPFPPPLVVTRHPGLVEVLREMDLIPDGVRVIAHATIEDVAGRHVVGTLDRCAERSPWAALKYAANLLTLERLDWCAEQCPWEALAYASDLLTPERKKWCKEKLNEPYR